MARGSVHMGVGVPLRYELAEQPDGITCGPTCLSMVHGAVARRHGLRGFGDILGVGAMCGTNPSTGTTHEGVAVAARGLGLAATRHVGREAFLAAWPAARDAAAPVLLRTLTHGVKHWVVAAGPRGDGTVRGLDPWLGDIRLDDLRVAELVAPRDHEIWVVDPDARPRELALVPARSARVEATMLLDAQFGHLVDVPMAGYLDARADWDLSRALVVDGRVAGVYLLKECSPAGMDGVSLPGDMEGLSCVEGVALATDPALRGMGYGRLLRDQPRALGFEMVWGEQHKELANLDHWLRRRRLIGDVGDSWVTAAILPRPEPEPSYAP